MKELAIVTVVLLMDFVAVIIVQIRKLCPLRTVVVLLVLRGAPNVSFVLVRKRLNIVIYVPKSVLLMMDDTVSLLLNRYMPIN